MQVLRAVALVAVLLGWLASPASADSYFNSSECPISAPGIPVNPAHLTCDDFEDGNWFVSNLDPGGGSENPLNDGWWSDGSKPEGLANPPGAAVCGAGVAAFGNCAATGGPQGGNPNVCCAGAQNIAHHSFRTPTCSNNAKPYPPFVECTVNELYWRVYARWDFTTFGNTKWVTITNRDGDIAFPSLYANNGGVGPGGTTEGSLTIAVNYCDPPPSTTGCTNPTHFNTWNSQAFNLMDLVRNHWYFIEYHLITDAKTGVYGSGRLRVWGKDCGLTVPGACTGTPPLLRDIQAAVPGNPGGQRPTNIHFDFWTGYANVGNGPYMDNLVVSTAGPIGYMGAVAPPTAFGLPGGAGAGVYNTTGAVVTLPTPLPGPTLIGFVHRAALVVIILAVLILWRRRHVHR